MAAVGGLAMTASAADTASTPAADGFSIQANELDASDAIPLSNFSLSVGNAKAKVGEQTTLSVTIKASGGFKGNEAYPNKIKGIAGSNITAPEKVAGSVSGKSITFAIPVTPTASGAHKLTGKIKFGICNDTQCLMKSATLNATVTGT